MSVTVFFQDARRAKYRFLKLRLEKVVFTLVVSGIGDSRTGNMWIKYARILPLRSSRIYIKRERDDKNSCKNLITHDSTTGPYCDRCKRLCRPCGLFLPNLRAEDRASLLATSYWMDSCRKDRHFFTLQNDRKMKKGGVLILQLTWKA